MPCQNKTSTGGGLVVQRDGETSDGRTYIEGYAQGGEINGRNRYRVAYLGRGTVQATVPAYPRASVSVHGLLNWGTTVMFDV